MLPEELLWVIALDNTSTYHAMVTAIPQLTRKITLSTQCDHKILFGYDVKIVKLLRYFTATTWYLNGKLHRTNGPAVEYAGGGKEYYINDELHRTDGPAIERTNGTNYYYLNGNLHRTDGPAIERANGTKAYYLDGIKYKIEDYQLLICQS